ncbi:hypothetical protein EVAR_99742_1 [Eumeta japonica]|uniref:Uncharacterized protein n=1 Tax=Eumeta variegata TaxID=151549 RepID=A0A4C1Z2H2_EUMVA|nr:hypothetical protein EVAR_99742_1 [Eumeta japonica]
MKEPPDDSGQPSTNVLPFLLAPLSPASFVTVYNATTMSCSEVEINKKKSARCPFRLVSRRDSLTHCGCGGLRSEGVSLLQCSVGRGIYTYSTNQCYNCCRYEHTKAQWGFQPRCFKCGNAHIGESCTVREDEVSCFHCLGRYTATSKLCPELDRQKRIYISMAEKSIYYFEASKKHSLIGKPYANAAASTLSNPSAQ